MTCSQADQTRKISEKITHLHVEQYSPISNTTTRSYFWKKGHDQLVQFHRVWAQMKCLHVHLSHEPPDKVYWGESRSQKQDLPFFSSMVLDSSRSSSSSSRRWISVRRSCRNFLMHSSFSFNWRCEACSNNYWMLTSLSLHLWLKHWRIWPDWSNHNYQLVEPNLGFWGFAESVCVLGGGGGSPSS